MDRQFGSTRMDASPLHVASGRGVELNPAGTSWQVAHQEDGGRLADPADAAVRLLRWRCDTSGSRDKWVRHDGGDTVWPARA